MTQPTDTFPLVDINVAGFGANRGRHIRSMLRDPFRPQTATYIVTGDAGHLDGWTVATLAAALRPALSPLGVDVVERPTDHGCDGGLIAPNLADLEMLDLAEEVQRIVEHVVSSGV